MNNNRTTRQSAVIPVHVINSLAMGLRCATNVSVSSIDVDKSFISLIVLTVGVKNVCGTAGKPSTKKRCIKQDKTKIKVCLYSKQ